SALPLLEFSIRTICPKNRGVLHFLGEYPRMTGPTEERRFSFFANGGDLHQLFENAQASACRLALCEALQRACFLLCADQRGVQASFQARWSRFLQFCLKDFAEDARQLFIHIVSLHSPTPF